MAEIPVEDTSERLKLVFLNAWAGKLEPVLGEFIEEQAKDTDIFCFQEANGAMKGLCDAILSRRFQEVSDYKQNTQDDDFPQATYIREGVDLLSSRTLFGQRHDIGLGIYTEVNFGGESLHLYNMHGISRPVDKRDSPYRLRQSATLIRLAAGLDGPVVIGGDFNLSPDTESIQRFAEAGYRNLVEEYAIPTTRNRYAWERYPKTPHYHSDYVFTRGDIQVTDFSVPDDTLVSDHLPMIVELKK